MPPYKVAHESQEGAALVRDHRLGSTSKKVVGKYSHFVTQNLKYWFLKPKGLICFHLVNQYFLQKAMLAKLIPQEFTLQLWNVFYMVTTFWDVEKVWFSPLRWLLFLLLGINFHGVPNILRTYKIDKKKSFHLGERCLFFFLAIQLFCAPACVCVCRTKCREFSCGKFWILI